MKYALMLCTGNSCRSQMAQVLAEKHFPSDWKIFSAGTEKHGLNPMALEIISKHGLDTKHLSSNRLEEYRGYVFDLVFSVCDKAMESCPHMAAKNHIHQSFGDPPSLAKGLDRESSLNIYNKTFEEIESFIKKIDIS